MFRQFMRWAMGKLTPLLPYLCFRTDSSLNLLYKRTVCEESVKTLVVGVSYESFPAKSVLPAFLTINSFTQRFRSKSYVQDLF